MLYCLMCSCAVCWTADPGSPTRLILNFHWTTGRQSHTAAQLAASDWLFEDRRRSPIGYCICQSDAGKPPGWWCHIVLTPFLLGSSRVQIRRIRFGTDTSNDSSHICHVQSSGRRDTSSAVTRTHNVVRKRGLGLSAGLWGRETGGFLRLLFECCWLATELAPSYG